MEEDQPKRLQRRKDKNKPDDKDKNLPIAPIVIKDEDSDKLVTPRDQTNNKNDSEKDRKKPGDLKTEATPSRNKPPGALLGKDQSIDPTDLKVQKMSTSMSSNLSTITVVNCVNIIFVFVALPFML
jgi:hypothetical protein